MNKECLQDHIQKNRWLYIALIFFIVWKFFLIHTLWYDRILPPVPDDSLVYALHIDGSLNCANFFSCPDKSINTSNFSAYDHLTYRLLMSVPAKLFGWDVMTAYQYGFYIGTLLLAAILFLFSQKLAPHNPTLAAYTVFLFTLFNGSGAFHGFYWVVPSFFALLFFLLVASLIIDKKPNPRWGLLALTTVLGIFTHILFFYALFILVFYCLFYCIFTQKISWSLVQKVLFVIVLASLIHFSIEHYYQKKGTHSPYGPLEVTSQLLAPETPLIVPSKSFEAPQLTLKLKINLPDFHNVFAGWEKINNNYFRWIFYNFLGYLLFCLCFALLLYYKQHELLSLYLGSLLLTLFSSLNTHGERSLLFLWAFTFLYYGYGAWFFVRFTQKIHHSPHWQLFWKGLTAAVFLFFAFMALFYSFLWNKYLNEARNFSVEPALIEYLESLPTNKTVYYSEKAYILELIFTLQHPEKKPHRVGNLQNASYYITIDDETVQKELKQQSLLFQDFFKITSTILIFRQRQQNPDSTYQEIPENPEIQLTPEKTFGDFVIYKVTPHSSPHY